MPRPTYGGSRLELPSSLNDLHNWPALRESESESPRRSQITCAACHGGQRVLPESRTRSLSEIPLANAPSCTQADITGGQSLPPLSLKFQWLPVPVPPLLRWRPLQVHICARLHRRLRLPGCGSSSSRDLRRSSPRHHSEVQRRRRRGAGPPRFLSRVHIHLARAATCTGPRSLSHAQRRCSCPRAPARRGRGAVGRVLHRYRLPDRRERARASSMGTS
ncbi:hypothetical protein C8T65DRAFT_638347 [Cerioporus squamosus]|nr:hypothetical protein C8T65DRAFT_638347 [Cerioporus squamosus]